MAEPVHVIVDGGVDDAVALAVLLGLEVPLSQVIATEGSMDLAITARTTRRLMVTLGSASPVRLGSGEALSGAYPAGRDPMHGVDAFGGKAGILAPASAPDEHAAALDGTVFCAGALTCVARAIQAGQPVTEVVWMGGAVAVGGNMTAAAEFNAWMDPVAADQVLTSEAIVKMIPLDLTERFEWSADAVAALRGAGRAGELLAEAVSYVQERDGIFVPHDAVTAIAVTSPVLFSWNPRLVRCETKGQFTTGETVVDRRPFGGSGQVLVADDADLPEVTARMLAAIASVPLP